MGRDHDITDARLMRENHRRETDTPINHSLPQFRMPLGAWQPAEKLILLNPLWAYLQAGLQRSTYVDPDRYCPSLLSLNHANANPAIVFSDSYVPTSGV